jgi:osmotically-inducible protein OsmY
MRRFILCALCLVLAGFILHGCKSFKVGASAPWANDAAITSQIKALIAKDEELSHAGIRVFVLEGNVTLSGTVPDGEAKLRLLAGVKGLKGVRSIGDNLVVRKPG